KPNIVPNASRSYNASLAQSIFVFICSPSECKSSKTVRHREETLQRVWTFCVDELEVPACSTFYLSSVAKCRSTSSNPPLINLCDRELNRTASSRLYRMEYSSEQLNYFRICYIAFNLVPEGLRKIFRQEWDFRYKTTLGEWKDTPKNGLDFYNNESRRSRSKNARFLATIQNGNTAEWDCSCLFFAILFSDSIGTTISAAI
ncbi:hypothetical protein ACROYT_G035202, partial [Oculina patagonica]